MTSPRCYQASYPASVLLVRALVLLQFVVVAVLAKQSKDEEPPPPDSTAFLLQNPLTDLLLMPTAGVRYMCMFCYCFYHGCKVFAALPKDAAPSYKVVSFVMASTGGGILVPIFLNGIPVVLANDALALSIIVSYAIHHYFPVIRDVVAQSKILTVCFIVLFEVFRAGVAVNLIGLANKNIGPSVFGYPLFGPIIAGGVAGCGGAFFPLNKGLDPIKAGLATPMVSAITGAAAFHIFLSTSLSDGVIDATDKARFCLASYLIICGLAKAFGYVDMAIKKVKKE
eukprot:CAMPEP_0181032594 /NCGR_PEP_ID=MMETSP1070-20121207/6821_1 /TAXON_ID=265543 /ORGANISM="Minutocellus polymorphus, Strain NH13" /LENGTH=282 /DNA_ID=CAMNT_0023109993 /DNA_START=9 /DNA_END=857 /DNA_ORIENTATION=+